MFNSMPTENGRYTKTIIVLHWTIVVLIVAMMPMGKTLAGLDPHADKLFLMQVHALTGMTILVLSLTRLFLHVKGPRPADNPDWPGWMHLSSKFVHWGLIIVSLLVLTER